MIIIFRPLTLVTVPSLLNLSLRSCLTSWTGMAENLISLLLVLCCYISGLVHTCSPKSLLPDGVRVNPIQLTSSKSASPRCMSILFSHLCLCLNHFYSLYVLQLIFVWLSDVSKQVLFSIATQLEYVGSLNLLDVIVLKCKNTEAPQYAGLLVLPFRRICKIVKSDY